MRGSRSPAPLTGAALIVAAIAIGLGNFLMVLDTTIANVPVPNIAGALGVSPSQGTWVITSYAVAEAITVPLTGWLSKRFGAMRVFIACYLAFAVLSLLCGMATSLGMLIAGRVALGLVGGPLMPLSQMLLLRIFPKEKATTAIVIWAMTTLVGPVTGLLHGKRATAHWAVRDELALFEATLVDARVVTGSRAMTGAGVISGLDLAIDPMTAMRGRGMAGSTSPAFQNTIHAPCRFSEVSRF